MKKWKRVVVTVCVVWLCTMMVNVNPTDGVAGKILKASTENWNSIEVDGVSWEYTVFSVNQNQNPKHHNTVMQNVVTCVKVRLKSTNGHTDISIPNTIEGYPVYMITEGDGIGKSKVTKLTIPITIEWIDDRAFMSWESLKEVSFTDEGKMNSTGKKISEKDMYLYHMGELAFAYCESLETIPVSRAFSEQNDNAVGIGVYKGCINLKKAVIASEKEQVYIPPESFEECNLEEGIQFSDNIREVYIDNRAFAGTKMKNLEIPCDCSLASGAFAENKELVYAGFEGNVKGEGAHIFRMSFDQNEDTKLIFAGKETKLEKQALAYSYPKTVMFQNPEGNVTLGYRCMIDACINHIEFQNKNVTVCEGGLDSHHEELSKICFNNSGTTFLSDGAFYPYLCLVEHSSYPSVKEIVFHSKEVIYNNLSGILTYDLRKRAVGGDTKIIYGKDVERASGPMGAYLSGFSAVYIENPLMIHDVAFTNFTPKVYGYDNQKDISQEFEHIQKSGLKLRYEESEIVNTKGIDLEKLHVYTVLKTGEEIEISTGIIMESGELPDLHNEKGYVLQYQEKLENFEGNMSVRVYYQDSSDEIVIPVVSKKEKGMQAEWSLQYGNSLVEGQTIEVDKLVNKVILYYNDGTCEEKDFNVLEVQNPKVTKGKNKITVCLKKDKSITESFTCEVRENVVEYVIASYEEENVYLGDKIDVNKIQLKPVYLWQDPDKDTKLPCMKISKTAFDLKGINIIRVYYTDKLYSDMVVDVKVAKPIKVNASYKEGYLCYGVNEVIENKGAIEISVVYENQEVVSGSALEQPYQVNIVSCTEKEVVATVTYEGIKSDTVHIPIQENKIVKISPILEKDSVLEGNLVGREQVSGLRIYYTNGTSEMVNLDDLVQEQLQISERYFAVAGKWNTINITYMGISCTASVWGETDEVVALDIQYQGGEITVGNAVCPEDCKVYLLKKSGKKVRITEGFTLINPVISAPGETQVYISYGIYHGSMKVKGVEKADSDSLNVPNETGITNETDIANKTTIVNETDIENKANTVNETDTADKNNVSDEINMINGTNPSAGIAGKEVFSFHCNEGKIQATAKKIYCFVTGKNVKFTLKTENIRNVQYQFVVKGQKTSGKNWKNVKNNCISIKNTKEKYGILYIRYTLPNGKIKTVHTTGFCIDNTAPKVNVKKNQKYEKGKKLIFSDPFGVKWAKLDGKKIKSGTKVTIKGKHQLVVMDKAGNKKSISFVIR